MCPKFFEDVLSRVEGLKASTEALKACGMQQELAAHLILQCRSMGLSIILRAGSPPVYNQKRGPKSGFNLSKTSNQGFFKGSLAADVLFTRIEKGAILGHHSKDHEHLQLPITHPDYQHTVPLIITMQDIIKEIGPEGDLTLLSYDDGKLHFAYRAGKGAPGFAGQFFVDLTKGLSSPTFYSRPWDRLEHHPEWDETSSTLKKPAALHGLPDEVYHSAAHKRFKLHYVEHTAPSAEAKEAKIFANTPRTATELQIAIKESGVTDIEPSEHGIALLSSEEGTWTIRRILSVLSERQIQEVYDHCALAITGDWDGLALGHPTDIPQPLRDRMRVYNTFMTGPDKISEIDAFIGASRDYFLYLKYNPALRDTPLGTVLTSIDDPVESLFDEYSIQRAGCITPHEYVFQQLINYAYRDTQNALYGETVEMDALQESLEQGLARYHDIKDDHTMDMDSIKRLCIQTACDYYDALVDRSRVIVVTDADEASSVSSEDTLPITAGAGTGKRIKEKISNPAYHSLFKEHLAEHLKIAMAKNGESYVLPHPHHDHNVLNLFQHGFEMRNPYASNLGGAWLLITDEGGILYGETEKQLTDVLLTGDFLQKNHIDIAPGAKMTAGWGNVVAKQLYLKQHVPEATLTAYLTWKESTETSRDDEIRGPSLT